MKVTKVAYLFAFSISFSFALQEDCVDFFGMIVPHGNLYVPGPSVCTSCVCYHSQPLWCRSIYCDPPYFCKKFRVGERCCEFDCLDDPEDIIKEKERLRKRKRFLGIVYGGSSDHLHSEKSIIMLCICILSIIFI
ncbi:CLUMA_CG016336, isoform A [Clunio marinus]|uniref:CLUMA_CG016336, isoform A n=1 Tax=Clunio marinus TaxID=568069 RepID=A0A1J1ISU7_9DIPT|nr:CLUMA_CG016336, isoform A [Clunio marinus]